MVRASYCLEVEAVRVGSRAPISNGSPQTRHDDSQITNVISRPSRQICERSPVRCQTLGPSQCGISSVSESVICVCLSLALDKVTFKPVFPPVGAQAFRTPTGTSTGIRGLGEYTSRSPVEVRSKYFEAGRSPGLNWPESAVEVINLFNF
jgi:hypothetical protein